MKRALIAMLILALSPLFLNAQYIRVRVLNSQRKPIENVRVISGETFFSDAEGLVRVYMPADSVAFSRLGYMDQKLSLDQIARADYLVIMQVQEIELPTIRVRALQYHSFSPALDTQLIHPDTNASTTGSAELLLNTSSFSSSDSKFLGERQTLSLLGSLNRHTLVMLDGVALNSAGEAFDFSKIPVSQIERIEIIKGNASAYGGSAAIGGIVNIVSKSPSRMKQADFALSGNFGSYAMQAQQYQISLMQAAWALSAHYTHYYARNDFRYDTWWDHTMHPKRQHNAKTADSFFIKSSLQAKEQNLEYTLSQGSFVRELPGPINFLELYDDSHMSGTHWYHSLMHAWQYQNLDSQVQAFYQSDGSSYRNQEPTNAINRNHYAQEQINFGIQNRLSWSWRESWVEGIGEYKSLDYKFTQYAVPPLRASLAQGERENFAFGLKAAQKYALYSFDGSTQLSVRRDFSNEQGHNSWRMEQEFSHAAQLKYSLGASLGTAFSLPSLYDMYWIGDSETQGNPLLKNESSNGYNLRASIEASSWQINTAYYYNEIDDLIQWRQVYLYGTSWKPFNVGTAKIHNYEAEGSWQLHRLLSLMASITYTDARDYSLNSDGSPAATYGKYLSYTPKHKAQVSLKIADELSACTLQWGITGEQYSTPDNLIDPLPGFGNLDLQFMRKIKFRRLNLVLDAKLNNILDQRYEVYAYIPQPGFNWAGGINLSYNLY